MFKQSYKPSNDSKAIDLAYEATMGEISVEHLKYDLTEGYISPYEYLTQTTSSRVGIESIATTLNLLPICPRIYTNYLATDMGETTGQPKYNKEQIDLLIKACGSESVWKRLSMVPLERVYLGPTASFEAAIKTNVKQTLDACNDKLGKVVEMYGKAFEVEVAEINALINELPVESMQRDESWMACCEQPLNSIGERYTREDFLTLLKTYASLMEDFEQDNTMSRSMTILQYATTVCTIAYQHIEKTVVNKIEPPPSLLRLAALARYVEYCVRLPEILNCLSNDINRATNGLFAAGYDIITAPIVEEEPEVATAELDDVGEESMKNVLVDGKPVDEVTVDDTTTSLEKPKEDGPEHQIVNGDVNDLADAIDDFIKEDK